MCDSSIHTSETFIRLTWLIVCLRTPIHMCEMTHSCVWHDTFVWLYRRSSIATYTNGSCHIYEWFMPRIHKCAHEGVLDTIASQSHFWGTQVTHMNKSCPKQTHEWVMSHMLVSYVTHMNDLHFWIAHGAHVQHSTMWMSHVKQMKDSCQTYEWVMSHTYSSIDGRCTQRSHVAYMNESCHTYKWALSHMWMSHDTRTNESWHSYEWVMSHVYSRINRRWPERRSRAHRREGTMSHIHSYVWHDLSICVAHSCVTHSYTWHGSFTCMIVVMYVHVCDMTIHMCDMTHSYVRHDSFISVTGLIYVWQHQSKSSHMRSYAWHYSFTCVTLLIYICDMAYSYGWHGSFMCDMPRHQGTSSHGGVWHESFMCDVTHIVMVVCDMNHWCVTWHICVTWLIYVRYGLFASGKWMKRVSMHVCGMTVYLCDMTVYLCVCLTWNTLHHIATPCKIQQHAATPCTTLQHPAKSSSVLQHLQMIILSTHLDTLQHHSTHCNTPQHTATSCNTLQHTATRCNTCRWSSQVPIRDNASPPPTRVEARMCVAWLIANDITTWLIYVWLVCGWYE